MKNNVRQIIKDKRAYLMPPAPDEEAVGFRGWHSRGYLPHFDAPGLIQFITFRLDDAMPAARRSVWEAMLQIEEERERLIRIEAYLDKGYGACSLRNPDIAAMVGNALLYFDATRYRLLAWVIMPNHVHALVEIWQIPLSDIVGSWKSFTSKEANRILARSGIFWQEDYFDRYIRDEAHFRKALHYIEWNPVKAHLVRSPEQWTYSSAANRSAGVSPACSTPRHDPDNNRPPDESP